MIVYEQVDVRRACAARKRARNAVREAARNQDSRSGFELHRGFGDISNDVGIHYEMAGVRYPSADPSAVR